VSGKVQTGSYAAMLNDMHTEGDRHNCRLCCSVYSSPHNIDTLQPLSSPLYMDQRLDIRNISSAVHFSVYSMHAIIWSFASFWRQGDLLS